MSTRRRAARFLLAIASLALAMLPGCWAAHEALGPAPLAVDASFVRDAGSLPPREDAGAPPPDTGTDAFADPGPCGLDAPMIAVRIEPVTLDADRCRVTHVDLITVSGIEAAPEDGIRIHADFCPSADADCRCDLVVTHVGSDLAERFAFDPFSTLSLDVQPGEDEIGAVFVSVRQAPRCRCDGCACSLSFAFYAATAPPDLAPALPPELTFGIGAEVCPNDGCVSGAWLLRTPWGTDLAQGMETGEGPIHVRSARNVDIVAACAACAGCGSPRASWVAWVSG